MGNDRGRPFWGAYALILLVVIMLAFRAVMAMGTVLQGVHVARSGAGVRVDRGTDPLVSIEDRDNLLESARIENRDPFSDPKVEPAQRLAERREPRPRPPEAPGLRALLFDAVNPVTRLILGTDESGWLHVGESFQGWTVTEIRPDQVTIARDDRQVVLRPS